MPISHLFLPRNPHASAITRKKPQPIQLSLTNFVVFLSSGSQTWETSEPGSHPCSPPCPRRSVARLVWRRAQPRGKRKSSYSPCTQLALAIKTTELPQVAAPPSHPASSSTCSERPCCRHEREEAGTGEMASRRLALPLRKVHFWWAL